MQRYDPKETAPDARALAFEGVHAMCVRSEAFFETLLQLGGATFVWGWGSGEGGRHSI